MENIESIIYSKGITGAKKKLNLARKKPLKNNKNITFKSKKVVEVVASPSEAYCCEKKDTRKTTIVLKRKKVQINTEEIIN